MPIRFAAFCSNELMVVVILWCEKPYLYASPYHLDSVQYLKIFFLNFSCMFLNPNIFFPIWILIVLMYQIWETSRNKLRKHSVPKNCSDLSLFEFELFQRSQKFWKFSAFSLEFQKFFSITRTICLNSERSEQFLVTECFFNLFLEVSQI